MTEYSDVITAALQAKGAAVGKPVTARIANSVDGLTVDEDCTVTALERPGKAVFTDLIDLFTDDFGPVALRIMAKGIADMALNDIDLPPAIERYLDREEAEAHDVVSAFIGRVTRALP